ncbi:MAG: 1-acyl-sn-glycerol-3-phosphate acyltransferase [Thermoanaerobaculales bacterium]
MFVPLYWLIPLAVLAAVALLERVLLPGVRVVLRRNVRHLVEELNQKLRLKLQPFKLTKKRVIEAMIVHDPEVALAARQYQEAHDLTWTEVADLVEAYAREIVPTFNVYLYYRLAHWFARRLARALYRVRVGFLDKKAFAAMDTEASVVFVMNHRSNLDYVLVSYLVARHAAISYAVGEWARVWPLDTLIRRLGAYFVRRNTSDPLYRKVLERYVQLSREAGVTQGIFPEGGLTRDGHLREPKLGLLNYVLKRFDPNGPRDLVFVPVGINYDRVLEDRTQILGLTGGQAQGRLSWHGARVALVWAMKNLVLVVRGRFRRFGYACVNFGVPVSTRDHLKSRGVDLRALDGEAYRAEVELLGQRLMREIARSVPATPVTMTCLALAGDGTLGVIEEDVQERVAGFVKALRERDLPISVQRSETDDITSEGLRVLVLRRLATIEDGIVRVHSEDAPLVQYYANSIAHLFEARG